MSILSKNETNKRKDRQTNKQKTVEQANQQKHFTKPCSQISSLKRKVAGAITSCSLGSYPLTILWLCYALFLCLCPVL